MSDKEEIKEGKYYSHPRFKEEKNKQKREWKKRRKEEKRRWKREKHAKKQAPCVSEPVPEHDAIHLDLRDEEAILDEAKWQAKGRK